MKHSIIGFKELRENADKYISAVKKGKRFLVMRKSEELFVLVPANELDEMWETVVDFTSIKRGGIPILDLLKRL